jgi:hypothetical protein
VQILYHFSISLAMNALFELVFRDGPLSATEAAFRLGVDPATVKRQAKAAGSAVLALGRGKATRYAAAANSLTGVVQLPLHWIDEAGRAHEFATLSHVAPDHTHVYGHAQSDAPRNTSGLGVNAIARGDYPWFLTPLKLRGYLGRAARFRLGAIVQSWDTHPERWTLAQQLFASQSSVLDHAGAILMGDDSLATWQRSLAQTPFADDEATLATVYDQLAHDAMSGRVAGSSADGEQPKFSTRVVDAKGNVREVLVKFSPPRGTPFGERWNDLLHTEAIAADVLHDNGFAVPRTRILRSKKRTYFESARIDRIGERGRRHLLPLHAVHAAFNTGAQQHWANSIAQLAAQKRIAYDAVATTQTLYAFGQLIGNTDMHFGNLSVIAESPQGIAKGRFTLAPCYDMLPMRFAPNAHSDLDYTPFATELSAALPESVKKIARAMASEFWRRIASTPMCSDAWRAFSATRDRSIKQGRP